RAAEDGQAGVVGRLAAVADRRAAVVGELDDPHAEAPVGLDERRLVFERLRALELPDTRELPARLGLTDLLDRRRQAQPVVRADELVGVGDVVQGPGRAVRRPDGYNTARRAA